MLQLDSYYWHEGAFADLSRLCHQLYQMIAYRQGHPSLRYGPIVVYKDDGCPCLHCWKLRHWAARMTADDYQPYVGV